MVHTADADTRVCFGLSGCPLLFAFVCDLHSLNRCRATQASLIPLPAPDTGDSCTNCNNTESIIQIDVFTSFVLILLKATQFKFKYIYSFCGGK